MGGNGMVIKTLNTQRNCSIDLFRLVCAVMVVSIHTHPLSGISDALTFFINDVFPRIAVPFFFCTSGYYYIRALRAGKTVFKKTFLHLLTIYSAWSAIYFLKKLLVVFASNGSLLDWILTYVKNYFIFGSEYHLWFFPALFFCLFVVTLFYKIKQLRLLFCFSLALYALGCLGCSYYAIGEQIPVVQQIINLPQFEIIRRVVLMGLPFYMLGYALDAACRKIRGKRLTMGLVISVVLFLAEIVLVTVLGMQKNVIITFGLYALLLFVMLFLLQHPFTVREKTAHYARGIANFMFYSHPLVMSAILFLSEAMLPGQTVSTTLLFLLTVLLTSLAGFLLVKMDHTVLNKWLF